MKEMIELELKQCRDALDQFIDNPNSAEAIAQSAQLMVRALKNGNAIYSCGNGGSMSDAMHFAEELTGRYRHDRTGLPATAISDPGHISCVANDYGYEFIFSRYLQARGKAGDVLLAISTSGTSKNVVKAAEYAKENAISVISLTGKPDTVLGKLSDVDISTAEYPYADRAQEIHIKVIHILIQLIERQFFPGNYST